MIYTGKGVVNGSKNGKLFKIKNGDEINEKIVHSSTFNYLKKQGLIGEGDPKALAKRIKELEAQVKKNQERAGDKESASHKPEGKK